MTVPQNPSGGARAVSDVRGLVVAALVVLGTGFVLTAVGSVWTALTPIGTGVNFPAGLLYTLGMLVGVAGLGLATAAVVTVVRASRSR